MSSKRRSRKSKAPEPASPPQSSAVERAKTSGEFSHAIERVLAVLAGVAIYVFAFYRAPPFRLQTALGILAPDAIISDWFGEKGAPLGFFDRLPLLLLALAIVALGWTTGTVFIRGWRLDRHLTRLETELFSIGVGMSLWSIWTLLVGLFGLLSQTWLLWLPGVVTASVAGFQVANRQEVTPAPSIPKCGRGSDWLWPSTLLLAIPFVLFYLWASLLPPVTVSDFDVREYHLQVPKEWFLAGQVTFLPHNVYGNMPLGAEMFALLAMTIVPGADGWWYGALVGKCVMAILSLLTALVLFAAGRRMGSNTAGVIAALVYISTPWIYLVSVSGRNEGVLAFYLALAVYAVWLWRMESGRQDASATTVMHLLKLAGFFAGSAAAVKYPAVLFVVAPLTIAVTVGHRKFDWKSGLVFLVGVFAASGLWYAKNWALAGNPVYPLAYSVFGGETRTPENAAQWNQAHRTPPYSATEFTNKFGRVLLTSEWLSPLLWPLALLAVLAMPHRKTAFWLAALLAFWLVTWWLFTHRIDRFWVPSLALVAWLAGIGATWSAHPLWKQAIVAVLFWGLVANFLLLSSGWYEEVAQDDLPNNRIFVSLESLKHDRFVSPAAHRFLNEHTPRNYQVLLVGDAAPFDLRVPALYNTCFDEVIFDQIFQGRTRAERLAALRERHIAYIYIDWSEIERYRSPGNYGFSDYITRELVQQELVGEQQLLKKVEIPNLKLTRGEIFEVVGVVPKPE